MHQAIEAAAARVAAKRRELEERLGQMRLIVNPVQKLQHAPLVAAAIFELLDHQGHFNQAAIAEISTLADRCAKLEQRLELATAPIVGEIKL